jgi:hypothetical protein
LGIEEFVLEGLQGIVVQAELHFERPIGHTTPLAQEGDHLIHHRDKVHPVPSLPGARPPCSWQLHHSIGKGSVLKEAQEWKAVGDVW